MNYIKSISKRDLNNYYLFSYGVSLVFIFLTYIKIVLVLGNPHLFNFWDFMLIPFSYILIISLVWGRMVKEYDNRHTEDIIKNVTGDLDDDTFNSRWLVFDGRSYNKINKFFRENGIQHKRYIKPNTQSTKLMVDCFKKNNSLHICLNDFLVDNPIEKLEDVVYYLKFKRGCDFNRVVVLRNWIKLIKI